MLEGRYTVGPRMARGGTGGVYRAVDERLDRTVAVKIMHPHLTEDPNFVGRFAREARAAARLSHPHVVAVLDQGRTDDGLVFLVMEFVEGGTLRDVLNRKHFLTPGQALELLAPILEGLASAHRVGLVHRDIKPENVLMRTDGTVKVADFGLSRGADQHTTTGAVLGTVAYAAPELVKEQPVGTRSDVYSAGILAWEMLAGKRPFQGSPLMMARAQAEDLVPALSDAVPGIAEGVSAMVAGWTSKSPGDRPADAEVMVAQLARLRLELDETALSHVPAGWEQGPGPLAPVLADPGASVLPDSAPATGPVEELRDLGGLRQGEAPTEAIGRTEAIGQATPWTDPAGPTEAISTTAEPDPATPVRPGTGDSAPAPPATQIMSTTAPAAGAPAGTPSARDLGVFDDTTSISALTDEAGKATDRERSAGDPGDSSSGAMPSAWGRLSSRIGGKEAADTDASGALVESRSDDPAKPTVRLTSFAPLRIVVILALTALLVSLAGFLGWLLGSGSLRTEQIPSVQGTSTEQAEALAGEQGFGNVRVYEQASTEVPAGTVIGTRPGEGTQMRVGEQLSILVSTGPEQVSVPALEGLSQDEATSRLDNAGLTAGSVSSEFSESPEGSVIAVSPAVSTQLDQGSAVDLTVSAGAEPAEVPRVVGSTADDATSRLEELGFTVEREDVAGGYLGRVVGQSQDGTVITLRVI